MERENFKKVSREFLLIKKNGKWNESPYNGQIYRKDENTYLIGNTRAEAKLVAYDRSCNRFYAVDTEQTIRKFIGSEGAFIFSCEGKWYYLPWGESFDKAVYLCSSQCFANSSQSENIVQLQFYNEKAVLNYIYDCDSRKLFGPFQTRSLTTNLLRFAEGREFSLLQYMQGRKGFLWHWQSDSIIPLGEEIVENAFVNKEKGKYVLRCFNSEALVVDKYEHFHKCEFVLERTLQKESGFIGYLDKEYFELWGIGRQLKIQYLYSDYSERVRVSFIDEGERVTLIGQMSGRECYSILFRGKDYGQYFNVVLLGENYQQRCLYSLDSQEGLYNTDLRGVVTEQNDKYFVIAGKCFRVEKGCVQWRYPLSIWKKLLKSWKK